MALDGVFLNLVKRELEPLIGGRVDKIHQPSREELLVSLRTRDGAYRLLFNTGAGTARVHATRTDIENPKVPPMFCMLMRKQLSGGKLMGIRQDGLERILYFDFDSSNEMGDICRLTLAIEIMGRHSNLILINSDGRIIDSIKRVGQDMSQVRPVLPGMEYTLPPKEPRLSLISDEASEIAAAVRGAGNMKLPKALMSVMEGISPVFAREAEFYAGRGRELTVPEMTADELDRLAFYLKKTAAELSEGSNRYTILRTPDGQFKDFCFTEIRQYENLMVTSQAASACETLDRFYSERDRTARMKQKAQDLFRLLVNTSERISRRTANQQLELKECADRDKLKKYGDLIMSNLYRLQKGDASADVEDFYEEGSPTVHIPLERRLTPTQNAQRYYKEYRKAVTAEKKLRELIKQGEEELAYIDSVFDALTRAAGETDIAELREELSEQGYVKRSESKQKLMKNRPPLKFISSDGYEIRVGRNNKQNDRLTCKDSEKLDIWLHTKDITGSHTVISCHGEQPPERTITEAAVIAAYHSKGRSSSQVPVDYTLIKNVKKPAGAKPGMVIFYSNKTLYVTPDEELVKKLAEG
ncbi:MAG: NFACT family protein [Ruminococcus sp.]|nr:NFACT family protein [Ruminococcus sp.]